MQILFMAIDWKATIFGAIGGLGLFLFGMELLGDSLKKLAGSKLKIILEKTTNTPIKGILVGIFVTGIIQSSSATTVLVVGLTRAGLMTFPQAIGVIFGANIGTTITSVLIGLDVGAYALPIMFVGAALIFFIPKKKIKELGKVLMGFGMLFFGLETMGDPLKQLVSLPEVQNLFTSVSKYPILGIFTGMGVTGVVQSSSATVGLLQQMYSTGSVPLLGAISIVFGCNIGTTVTALLASAGAPSSARRTAAIHTLFNVIGTVMFTIILRPYTQFIAWLAQTIYGAGWETNRMTVSLAHVIFNVTTVFILYWFIKPMTRLVTKMIPSKNEIQVDDLVLDPKLIEQSPVLALTSAHNAIINMGNVVKGMFEFTYDYSFQKMDRNFEMGMQCEEILDTMDDKIHNYLVRIGTADLDRPQIQELAKDIDTIGDLERIGDHLTNLLEFFQERYDNNIPLHPDAQAELEEFFSLLRKSITEALAAYADQDKQIASEVNAREEVIDHITKKFRKNHIARVQDSSCTENEAGYYVDILSNMERIGDHCDNIVVNVLSEFYTHDDNFAEK